MLEICCIFKPTNLSRFFLIPRPSGTEKLSATNLTQFFFSIPVRNLAWNKYCELLAHCNRRRVGHRWITRFLALGCYAFLLFPGFVQVGYYYFFSKQILWGVVYGEHSRNRLDLYLPKNLDGPKSVVAFVTGGAWIIGCKAWGSFLGMQLAERDVIVACIDYRNFPQGTISDMVKDASQGVLFVCNNIAKYGGDPNITSSNVINDGS